MKSQRYLIARIDRIGDVVLSTPLPREIKKKYPDSFVCVLVRNYTKDIYLNNPNVDLILTYDNIDGSKKSFWQLLKEIKKLKFSYGFMLLSNERLSYLFLIAGIPVRIGVGHKLYQILTFTKYVNRKKYNPLRHEADYGLDMLRKIGYDIKNIKPEIFLSDDERAEVKKIKEKYHSSKKKIIGINVTSGNSAPNLSRTEYKRLILFLMGESSYQIAVMDKEVPDLVDKIDGVIYPNRNNNLRSSIVNFASLNLLVSSSTGPMHLAAALKVPTLSLFCPLTACSPKLWGPLGNDSEIILPSKQYCETKCPIDPKKCDYSKEGGLTAQYLAESIKNFLKFSISE
jgi:ADP-heptose:LPS heptosyltransferase